MRWRCAVLTLLVLALAEFATARDAPLALVGGLLIDGTGRDPIADATVLIEDGRIVAVGPGEETQVPAGATVVDVGGGAILPGFINAHVHDAFDADKLQAWARSGVTTVCDLGVIGRWTNLSLRVFEERDTLNAEARNARLVAAGPLVTTVAGYGGYAVRSPEDARQKVAGLIAGGADLIKIAIEDDLQNRKWPMLTLEEIEAIVETAHAAGLRVVAHISRSEHIGMALDAGVDSVAHGAVDTVSADRIAQMVDAGMVWVQTLELWSCVARIHGVESWLAKVKTNLSRFVAAGGRVALGTDFAGYVCDFELGMPMTEVRLMAEAGMTPMQIIEAGTRNSAAVFGLEADLGTIEPGKIADLIVVDGNPLEDLETLTAVRWVLRDGELIRDGRVSTDAVEGE